MPVQTFDTRPVNRPSGLISPDASLTGTTELRLHGVGGTTPQDLLGDLAPQLASGDRIAGFYRTADLPDRHIEAYSWGGLTSRSGSRVLWVLLFPFALANVAGWMCSRRTHGSTILFGLHRTVVRWAALGVTINLILLTAMMSMDIIGYQCGGSQSCAGNTWLLHLLRYPGLAGHPARRILVGAAVPLGLVVLLAILALRSIGRYEDVRPPYSGTQPPPRATGSAAVAGAGLRDRTFWDGRRGAFDQGCLHIAASLGLLTLVLAGTSRAATTATGLGVAVPALWWLAMIGAGLAIGAALVLTATNTCPVGLPVASVATGLAALCCAGWFALRQPGPAAAQAAGALPGMRTAAGIGFGAILVSLAAVLVVSGLGSWQRGTFFVLGPFVTLGLALISLNAVLLASMIRVADWLGTVTLRGASGPGAGTAAGATTLYFSDLAGRAIAYLTVGPGALIVVFGLVQSIRLWRSGVDSGADAAIRKSYVDEFPAPTSERIWWNSSVAAGPEPEPAGLSRSVRRLSGRLLGTGWLAGVARARWFARIPREADTLLTAVTAAGIGLLAAFAVQVWWLHAEPWTTSWLMTVGSYLGAWLPVIMILVLRRGWRSLASRRHIGVIWDVTTFWPRAYHPLAPPCYAERAVPELQRRLWRIHDNDGRVVLVAHSQGTILAAAALLQPHGRPADDRVALVTFGSPLRTLYGWAFPAYFNDDVLRELGPTGGAGRVQVYSWRNFYYLTDYIGGAVLTEPNAVDERLADPTTCWYLYAQAMPAAGRHSGYWGDANVWRYVDGIASELTRSRLRARQPFDATVAAGEQATTMAQAGTG
jgi:hypothetical protein